jgi:hypothetical protein
MHGRLGGGRATLALRVHWTMVAHELPVAEIAGQIDTQQLPSPVTRAAPGPLPP